MNPASSLRISCRTAAGLARIRSRQSRGSRIGTSLDIETFVFIETTDWNEFTGIREDINLRILDIVAGSGAYFAYPSQTLYLGRDAGRDPERTTEAEAKVEEWRSAGNMPIPEFPESMIGDIDGTLDYPPAGSSHREPAAGVSPVAVGVTVVASGTSSPESVVAVISSTCGNVGCASHATDPAAQAEVYRLSG